MISKLPGLGWGQGGLRAAGVEDICSRVVGEDKAEQWPLVMCLLSHFTEPGVWQHVALSLIVL